MQSYLYSDGPEPGEVRLYYDDWAVSYYHGRVEIFLSQTWGRVTGSWTVANAQVVCHQLGYDIPSECSCTLGTKLYTDTVIENFPQIFG